MSVYDAFAPHYELWSSDMTEDVPFYASLAREADGPIVELAVGTGRVASEMARAAGRTVVGIDSSPAMLEKARALGADLDLRLGDMRTFELDEPAALIVCPFRSLLHMPTWEDKLAVFRRVRESLRPGGRFAFNAFVFDYAIAARVAGDHPDAPVPHRVEQVPSDSRVDLTLLESGARVSLWWCTRNEWDGLVRTSGLETEALYGWFDRRPFDESAGEFVWIARRPR